jgi:hypothetical protein
VKESDKKLFYPKFKNYLQPQSDVKLVETNKTDVVLRISIFNQKSYHHPIKAEFEILASRLTVQAIIDIVIDLFNTQGDALGKATEPAHFFMGDQEVKSQTQLSELIFKINYPYTVRHAITQGKGVEKVKEEVFCDHVFTFSDMYVP